MIRFLCVVGTVFFTAINLSGCSGDQVPQQSSKSQAPENTTSSEATGATESTANSTSTFETLKPSGIAELASENAPTDGMNWLTRDEISDGWIRLFDGQTLFGWKSNSQLTWSVRD